MNTYQPIPGAYYGTNVRDAYFAADYAKSDAAAIEQARAIHAAARATGTICQQPLPTDLKTPKGKGIPLGPISKRGAELRKRFPHLSIMQAARYELAALLAMSREVAA